MVDAPVPEQRCRRRAKQAADGQSRPGGETDVGDGQRCDLGVQPGIEEQRAENPDCQHQRSGEDSIGRHDRRAVRFHEFFTEQNPDQRGGKRGQHE